MPRELRTIIFDHTEVTQAMRAFATRQKTPMPPGIIDTLAFDETAEPALLLSVKPAGTPVAQKIAFRKAEVAAALILYCRERHIPLPKDCRKDLVKREGQPAFLIELP